MPPLVCAAIVVLLEGLSFGAIVPVMGYYNEHFGGSALMLGVLFALVSLPKVVTNPWFGRLADRVGRRPVLVVNTLGTLSGSVTWALAGGLGGLLALVASRLVTGVFSAQAGIAQAIAADVSKPDRRAAALALLGAAFGIAFGLGPVLGGVVAKAVSYAAVGWLCAAFQALSLLVILLLLRETRPDNPHAGTQRTAPPPGHAAERSDAAAAAHIFRRAAVAPLLVVILAMTIGQAQMISTFALVTMDTYTFDARQTGYAFGVIGLVGIIVQGALIRPFVQRMGERLTTLLGLALLALGYALIAAQPPLALFWTSAALQGLGLALSMPCITAMLSHTVDAHEQGRINGLQQSAMGLGRALGNVSGGILYYARGTLLTYGCAATLVTAAIALLAPVRIPRAAGAPADTPAQPDAA